MTETENKTRFQPITHDMSTDLSWNYRRLKNHWTILILLITPSA